MKKVIIGLAILAAGVGVAAYLRKQKDVCDHPSDDKPDTEKKFIDIFSDVKEGFGLLGKDISGAIPQDVKNAVSDGAESIKNTTSSTIDEIKVTVESMAKSADDHKDEN